jgi:sec-independent protein translocase protein TatC
MTEKQKKQQGEAKESSAEQETYMSFLDHLEELRFRLLRSIGAVILASILAGFFHKKIFLSLTRSVPDLYWHTPLEPYFTFLKISIVAGVFVAFPVVLHQLWRFVSPGLYQRERKYLLPFIISAWMLFVCGAVFNFFVILPYITVFLYGSGEIVAPQAPRSLEQRWQTVAEAVVALEEMQQPKEDAQSEAQRQEQLQKLFDQIRQDIEIMQEQQSGQTRVGNVWSVGRYVSLALMLFLAFGLAFDLPVVVIVLTLSGVVQPATLAKARPVVIVAIFVCSAILTPPDPASQVMMGLPMVFLFEISLVISRILIRLKRKKKTR